MKTFIGAIVTLGLLYFLLQNRKPVLEELPPQLPQIQASPEIEIKKLKTGGHQNAPEASIPSDPKPLKIVPLSAEQASDTPPGDILKYTLDEGLAVVNGDIVIGVPVSAPNQESGWVKAPELRVWEQREIPYHIQPGVKNPERVEQALALFASTAVRFVPYTDQKDVLVFEDSDGVCKSYIGKIGGKQPIWIPPGCEATEIAHELMHALGFIHEQNRVDRDDFIEVLVDNIDPQFKENFDKFSDPMMRLTGLAPFDFESVMIYPVSMFAKAGQSTMRTKNDQNQIRPSPTLSARDIHRLNLAFSRYPLTSSDETNEN